MQHIIGNSVFERPVPGQSQTPADTYGRTHGGQRPLQRGAQTTPCKQLSIQPSLSRVAKGTPGLCVDGAIQMLAATLTYGDLDVLPRNNLAFDSCCRAPADISRPRRKQHFPFCGVGGGGRGVCRAWRVLGLHSMGQSCRLCSWSHRVNFADKQHRLGLY